jgi:hypothetical protein
MALTSSHLPEAARPGQPEFRFSDNTPMQALYREVFAYALTVFPGKGQSPDAVTALPIYQRLNTIASTILSVETHCDLDEKARESMVTHIPDLQTKLRTVLTSANGSAGR